MKLSRDLLINSALGVAIVATSAGAYASLGADAPARSAPITATVTRGIVLASVSATGNVSAQRQIGLSFPAAGRLVALDVSPGDHVTKGQRLANIDDRAARDNLATARANLASAQARMALAQAGATPEQLAQDQAAAAQAQGQVESAQLTLDSSRASQYQNAVGYQTSVNQAQTSVNAARATAAQNATMYQTSVDQAVAQLAADQAQRGKDSDQLNADQAQLQTDQARQSQAQSDYDVATSWVSQDQADQNGCQKDPKNYRPQRSPSCQDVSYTLQQDQQAQQAANSRLSEAKQAVNAGKSAVNAGTAKLAGDDAKLVQDQNAVTNAYNAQASGRLKDQQSIDNAISALTNAQNNQSAGLLKDQQSLANANSALGSARAGQQSTLAANAMKEAGPTAADLAADAASVASAQAAVATAQRALDDTTLLAPADGTIASVASKVGEFVSSGAGAGSGAGASSGTTGFIVLTDLKTLVVKAGFTEADAAKVSIGQAATASFDALPNQASSARVISVETNATVVSNVVTYNVTALLDQVVEAVRPGMTSSLQVTIAVREDALRVPTSTVTSRAAVSTVTILQGKRQVTRVVGTGLKGDDVTEIVSGLQEGEKVVTSSGTSSLQLTGTQGGRLPTGGFGGGGLGGGAGVRVPIGGPGGGR